jgi:hypothetical protein
VLHHSDLDFSSFSTLLTRKCALRQVSFTGADDFLASDLQRVAQAEWERQLLPFVPDSPTANRVLAELTESLHNLPLAL